MSKPESKAAGKKRCFVIARIGDKNSEERRKLDGLLDPEGSRDANHARHRVSSRDSNLSSDSSFPSAAKWLELGFYRKSWDGQ
jgi:hypothetical protein